MSWRGKLRKNYSGHCFYEMSKVPSDSLIEILDILVNKFGLTLQSPAPIVGLDGTYFDLRKGEAQITLGWDVWSEYFVSAQCPTGDELVIEFGNYIDSLG
ncbi:MAG: hypothetical protein FWE96_00985 [Coriobacteriia bacterium]|nr:hypothetical protein [Coriobacteriia bacterium]